MNSKSLPIVFLLITALILFIANLLPVQSVASAEVIKDRQYTMATARSARGGDVVYVSDNRTGLIVVLVWEPGRRTFVSGGVGSLGNLFPQ